MRFQKPRLSLPLAMGVVFVPLLAALAFGQIKTEPMVGYRLAGVEGFTVIGSTVMVPEGSKPSVQPCGVIVIDCDAKQITVKASNVKREPVKVEQVPVSEGDNRKFLILGSGRVWVDITCIDFAREIFKTEEVVLKIPGPMPEPDDPEPEPEPDNPDPGPAPDVPDDAWDNIGKRVAKVSLGLPSNEAMANAYRNASGTLSGNPSVTIPEVAAALSEALKVVPNYQEYRNVVELINSDTAQRWPMTAGVLVEYWAAVALGLKAGG